MKNAECDKCSNPSMFTNKAGEIMCADCGAVNRSEGNWIRLLCNDCNNPAVCIGITVKVDKGYAKTIYNNDPRCERCCNHDKHETVPVLVSRRPLSVVRNLNNDDE